PPVFLGRTTFSPFGALPFCDCIIGCAARQTSCDLPAASAREVCVQSAATTRIPESTHAADCCTRPSRRPPRRGPGPWTCASTIIPSCPTCSPGRSRSSPRTRALPCSTGACSEHDSQTCQSLVSHQQSVVAHQ